MKVTIEAPSANNMKKGALLVELKVLTVSRDQFVKLRIVGRKGAEKIIQRIAPDAFNVRVKGKGDEVPYTIVVKSATTGSLTLRLRFPDIKAISSTSVAFLCLNLLFNRS
jgi:hypothetical protein